MIEITNTFGDITLFPDQYEALARVVGAYETCPIGGKALIVAATGWGKTIFFSALIHTLKDICKKPILIMAHRNELVEQARDKYHLLDPTAIIGKVGGGTCEYGAPITVASVDTIRGDKHIKQLQYFDYGLIICDEAHHAPAAKYQKVFNALPNAFRVGVTATPKRLDGKSLDPIFGPPLFEMDIITAVTKKRLSSVKAIAIRTETSLDDVKSKKNSDGEIDFDESQLDLVVNTPERNRRIVEAYQEHGEGKPFIVFGVSIAHAEALEYAFNDAGINTRCIKGSTSIPERNSIYKALKNDEITGLANVLVLTEGFDIKKIKCIILGRPTQSESLYKQMIGRGMRLFGDEICTLLDITDNCTSHSLSPQNLRKAINKHIKDNETIEEALVREEEEAEQRKKKQAAEEETRARKLKERRPRDIVINLLEKLEWVKLPGDGFVMTVRKAGHRIALIPGKMNPEFFFVAARLAPDFQYQKWSDEMSLEDCQQLAEKKARLLHDGGLKLVDQNQPWRNTPITEGQIKMLDKFKIAYGEGTDILTKGQASEALDRAIAARKKRGTSRTLDREEANVG